MCGKIGFLHLRQYSDNHTGIVALSLQSGKARRFRRQGLDIQRKAFSPYRQGTVIFLAVTTQINAQNPAIRLFGQKASRTVGIIFSVNAACPRPASFWEDHQVLFCSQKFPAGCKRIHDLVAIPAAFNGKALAQVADHPQRKVMIIIRPLRQIPGNFLIVPEMIRKRQKAVGND